ncbi:MAG: TRAP transporter permease [Clostridia bacterium]|nr:TRAP transporter permease [Clostridia bacterium]
MKKKGNTAEAVVDTASEQDLDAVMRKFDRESNTRIWEGKPKIVVTIIIALFAFYCIAIAFMKTLPEIKLSSFLGLITIIGYITYPANKKKVKVNSMPIYDILLMAVGAAAFFYFTLKAQAMQQPGYVYEITDILIGVVGILIMAELCRRCVGVPILCVAGALIIYAFVNQFSYGADIFQALKVIIYKLFYSTNGIIGTPVDVCTKYIVLFIIFGAFLERTGIANFFIDFANRIAGWSSGGPAKVAVISSALCGMVSGSSVGNTVTTGSVTIPMMKKTGYKPEFAGAVEAAASTGGQIMPPIMGAAAFLMAEYMNLDYGSVAVKAILPAVLYFTGIFIAVHLEAKKLGLKGISVKDLPKFSYLFKNIYLMIPLVVLVALVASGKNTMRMAAVISIGAAFLVGFINFLTSAFAEKKNTGDGAGKVIGKTVAKSLNVGLDALVAGGKGAITVAVACSMAGIIAGCITVTGLASVLINGIVQIAGNAKIIGLLLTMLCCIVLGMGVPTTANYCIMASTCAPILTQLGFPVVAAHFFVFYFGIVADITPPVALAAYAGSAIAKSNPMKTGLNATKLAIAAFIVPYIFAFSPEMLFEGVQHWYEVLQIAATSLVGLYGVAAALNGHLFKKIPVPFRILLVAGGIAMMIPDTTTDIIGFAVVAAITVLQLLMSKKNKATPLQTA